MVVRPLARAAAAAAALTGAAALAGCSNGPSGGGDTGFVSSDVGITAISASQRVAAPALSGTTLDGKQYSLAQDKGRIVVLNVWGSWCTPCREEAPALEETFQKFEAKGVRFVGINARDDNAAALAFDHSMKITYPSLQDPDETHLLQFKSLLPPASIPSSVILDRDGKVAVRIIGPVTEPQLTQQLDALLSKG